MVETKAPERALANGGICRGDRRSTTQPSRRSSSRGRASPTPSRSTLEEGPGPAAPSAAQVLGLSS